MKISIVIPTLNEASNIVRLLEHLQTSAQGNNCELIAVDGGSTDDTVALATQMGAAVLHAPLQGRAPQMNYGAAHAKGELLYFVHADTLPPDAYLRHIQKAIDQGYDMGCFQTQFDSENWPLKVNAWFTRFDLHFCRGGDQSLYISKANFEKLGGFREDCRIMEDFEFIKRARQTLKFKVMPAKMTISTRKYNTNSYLRVQVANLTLFNMYRFGASQESMEKTYRYLLKFSN